MRYKIEINLLALKNLNSKINLEEAVLLDYLYWLCSSPSEEVEKMRKNKDGKDYTWFDYGFYIKETPILKGKTKATITPKMKKLEDEGFIETFLDKDGRKYVRLLSKSDGLFRKLNTPVKKTKHPPFRKLNIDNNTILDNKTTDKDYVTSKEVTRKDQEIFDLINKFQKVNPSYKRLFANNTQREALQRLIDNFGKEKIEKLINTIAITNQMKFAPIITTPLELESKLGRLLSFIKQQQQSDKGKEFITTF